VILTGSQSGVDACKTSRSRRPPGPAGTRRHLDFRVAVAGTDVHPQFDRAVIVAWLLAHDKSEVPVAMPSASLLVTGGAGPRRSGSTARI
jgi:hypothetical protein